MRLTQNELEILDVLWKEDRALTGKEIIKYSINKTWKDSSIHILINSMLKKNAIKESGYVRTGKGFGRTFEPTREAHDFYAQYLANLTDKTNVSSFVSYLFQKDDISEETLDELETMIMQKKKELREKNEC